MRIYCSLCQEKPNSNDLNIGALLVNSLLPVQKYELGKRIMQVKSVDYYRICI